MVKGILEAWNNISIGYNEILGEEKATALCAEINDAVNQIRKKD